MLTLLEGQILPNTLIPDVPSRFSDYTPRNFTRTYTGAVPASEALSRSLNVPAVHELQEFGVPKFQHYLHQLGLHLCRKVSECVSASPASGRSQYAPSIVPREATVCPLWFSAKRPFTFIGHLHSDRVPSIAAREATLHTALSLAKR